MQVRPASAEDASQIAEIYNHYIETSHATFEIEQIEGAEMLRRIEGGLAAGYPFLVYAEAGEIAGYAYGRQFKGRRAYMHSIEVSVYVRPGCEGKQIGTMLYESLFDEIREGDFHAIIAGISLPNDTSVALHEKFGFEKVARFREVGRKFDRWIDVGYWELILDR